MKFATGDGPKLKSYMASTAPRGMQSKLVVDHYVRFSDDTATRISPGPGDNKLYVSRSDRWLGASPDSPAVPSSTGAPAAAQPAATESLLSTITGGSVAGTGYELLQITKDTTHAQLVGHFTDVGVPTYEARNGADGILQYVHQH
jgi:hypothetical protein